MNSSHASFGAYLVAIRKARGLTGPQLAELVGVSKGQISMWENDLRFPKVERFGPLAEALDVGYEDLLAAAGRTPAGTLPTFAPYLRAKYGSLPDEAQAEAEAFFEELQARYEQGGGDVERDH
jgi:transcriptional regulator with XRE-family HTH domain